MKTLHTMALASLVLLAGGAQAQTAAKPAKHHKKGKKAKKDATAQ